MNCEDAGNLEVNASPSLLGRLTGANDWSPDAAVTVKLRATLCQTLDERLIGELCVDPDGNERAPESADLDAVLRSSPNYVELAVATERFAIVFSERRTRGTEWGACE